MKFLQVFIHSLFGCSHARRTFPITISKQTKEVCLDCGKEFIYSWDEMRVTGRSVRSNVLHPCPVEAARKRV